MQNKNYYKKTMCVVISKDHKNLVADGAKLLNVSEKVFLEKAIDEHHRRINENSSLLTTMKKVGLI